MVLEEFKESTGHLRALLERFCELKADEYRPRVCSTWRACHAPPEVAADYAVKAQAYESFLCELLEA